MEEKPHLRVKPVMSIRTVRTQFAQDCERCRKCHEFVSRCVNLYISLA